VHVWRSDIGTTTEDISEMGTGTGVVELCVQDDASTSYYPDDAVPEGKQGDIRTGEASKAAREGFATWIFNKSCKTRISPHMKGSHTKVRQPATIALGIAPGPRPVQGTYRELHFRGIWP